MLVVLAASLDPGLTIEIRLSSASDACSAAPVFVRINLAVRRLQSARPYAQKRSPLRPASARLRATPRWGQGAQPSGISPGSCNSLPASAIRWPSSLTRSAPVCVPIDLTVRRLESARPYAHKRFPLCRTSTGPAPDSEYGPGAQPSSSSGVSPGPCGSSSCTLCLLADQAAASPQGQLPRSMCPATSRPHTRPHRSPIARLLGPAYLYASLLSI